MANKNVKSNEAKGQSKAVEIYLIAYNAIQTLGWSYLLYQLISFYLLSNTTKSLYNTVKCTVIIFQNAAVLEVVHAAMGMVKSNPVLTAFQVASRVIVVCGVLMATEAPRESIGLTCALTAWSITEIIRYATYTLNLLNIVPYVLKWLRYTLFIGLYPLGVTGELLCIYASQREVGDNQLYSVKMPNAYNFIFSYQHLLWFIMLLYIPLFPQLYLHMLSQRRKVLGATSKKHT
ncbi:very-long-chain (3R)-3-hydroxyacyl-CoA dehydratase 2 [Anoplophora glabripennis]|uniref:very-long-chain (3R)-3-hydroxyacyl-CoA dehydratase 2 n=1 Tax=Anoplophora glabripennis TaxID=217634 RepID=UPI000873767C|nr:very-long-chain (3R)-3-hydroxyacyl-CoA dehydratase 2 [Anoplophora glabripennis]